MSINRRLLIAFLFILLIPLLVSHIVAYSISSGMLTDRALKQLESVTSIQKKRIEAVVAQNLERLALVQSRTQLRQSLAAFIATHDKEHREKMIAILRDACLSIQNFQEISVFTMDGTMVASTSSLLAEKNFGMEEWFVKGKDRNHADDLFLDEKGQLKIYLTGPMLLQEKKIGVLVITSTIEPLISITQDYFGLGKTGETLIAKRSSEGRVVVINPLRFDPKASLQKTFYQEGPDVPITQVMQGKSVSLINSTDYRGKSVFASGEYIDDLDWGVVVKIDKDEALEPIGTLQIGRASCRERL